MFVITGIKLWVATGIAPFTPMQLFDSWVTTDTQLLLEQAIKQGHPCAVFKYNSISYLLINLIYLFLFLSLYLLWGFNGSALYCHYCWGGGRRGTTRIDCNISASRAYLENSVTIDQIVSGNKHLWGWISQNFAACWSRKWV